MRRVLHIIDSLAHGGAEHLLVDMLSAWNAPGYSHAVCYLHPPNYLEPLLTSRGVPVFCLGTKKKQQWPLGIVRLMRLIRRLRPDLIHTNLFKGDVIGGIAGRLLGLPVISTQHNIRYGPEWFIDNVRLSHWKLAVSQALKVLVHRTCHRHFIAVSKCVKDSVSQSVGVPSEKFSVVYPSISLSGSAQLSSGDVEALRRDLGVQEAYPVLLTVGRLMPQKGQKYLVEAMPRVVKVLPRVRLLMVGVGFLHDELVKLRDGLALSEAVSFLGRREDVPSLLQAADIFVFPSLFEGLPVALLEAMAASRPIVASRIDPVEEVLEDGRSGLLVPTQSPDALAEAILSLASHPEVAQGMARGARQVVEGKFTLEQMIADTAAVYDRVLAEPRH